jgi:hypothetical protein
LWGERRRLSQLIGPDTAPAARPRRDRRDLITEIVSDYLSEIIDMPTGSSRDSEVSSAATNKHGVSWRRATCVRDSGAERAKAIDRDRLSAAAKRKPVLDRDAPV